MAARRSNGRGQGGRGSRGHGRSRKGSHMILPTKLLDGNGHDLVLFRQSKRRGAGRLTIDCGSAHPAGLAPESRVFR